MRGNVYQSTLGHSYERFRSKRNRLARSRERVWGRTPHEGADAIALQTVNAAARYGRPAQRKNTSMKAAEVTPAKVTIGPAHPVVLKRVNIRASESHS